MNQRVMFISSLPHTLVCYLTVTNGGCVCEVSMSKHLGVQGVWERSLPSVAAGPPSLLWSRLGSPCSSDFPGGLVEGSRPDMNSMLCFRLSSLSY